jgi:hypothetical protein
MWTNAERFPQTKKRMSLVSTIPSCPDFRSFERDFRSARDIEM